MLWMDDAEQGYKRQNNLTKQHDHRQDKASQREWIEEPGFIPSAAHLSGSGTSLMTHHCFCWKKTGRSCKDNRWADTLCVFCNVLVAQWRKALGHLHIRAIGDAWPWKPIPWSSWCTAFVLMFMQKVCVRTHWLYSVTPWLRSCGSFHFAKILLTTDCGIFRKKFHKLPLFYYMIILDSSEHL